MFRKRGWGWKSNTAVQPVNPGNVSDPTIAARLDALLSKCGERDRVFLGSLKTFFARVGHLSAKQYDALVKCEYRYSAAAIAESENWRLSYDAEKRKIARIAAEYYLANPPYFSDLAGKIVNDPTFVPTEKQYRALVENKYATRAIAAAVATPMFVVGDSVVVRNSSKKMSPAYVSYRGQTGLVIKPDAGTVRRAAKGSKIYMILLTGNPVPVLFEERELRKIRSRKK